MSQAPQQNNDWFRKNYEKFLLLAALLVLFFSCIHLIRKMNAQEGDLKTTQEQLNNGGDEVDLRDTTAFESRLQFARESAQQEIEAQDHLFRSLDRVSCVKCGKPIAYEALKCPWCLGEQPEIVNVDTLDTDGDGIPDKIEQEWGLDPRNPMDARGDLDGDGFSNIEEYLAETNPHEASSMPDPIVKLRVAGIKARPFYLRFNAVSEDNKGQQFQLNLRGADRTFFARKGDIVEGYQITAYDPNTPPKVGTITLVRVADKRPVRLVRNRPVTENELVVRFVFLIDRTAFPPRGLNDQIELRGKTYKVVDIKPNSVVIQEESTGKKISVPTITDEERNPSQAQPQPAAQPADVWGGGF